MQPFLSNLRVFAVLFPPLFSTCSFSTCCPLFFFPHCKWVSSCWGVCGGSRWREGAEGSRAPVEKCSQIKPFYPIICNFGKSFSAIISNPDRPNVLSDKEKKDFSRCRRVRSTCVDHTVQVSCCHATDRHTSGVAAGMAVLSLRLLATDFWQTREFFGWCPN